MRRRVWGGGCEEVGCVEVHTVDMWRCGVGGMRRIVCCTFIRHFKAWPSSFTLSSTLAYAASILVL